MSEDEMLEGCKANQEAAQKHLFDRYARVMTGVCMRYADRFEEAQDIVQDGFVKVFNKIETYSGSGSLEGWIRRIMVNTALDYLRKIKHERFNLSIDDVEYSLKDSQVIESNMQADDLLKIIKTLPLGYRTVFNMYAIEGFSHKEIADELGISENTSKSQYSRARTLLQKKLVQIEIENDTL
ncbi:MAG: sigma-70 family RNA polymerase sigma factor [Bacteroidetes bacterium]|nr:MAG: sigma-70 family RNA polymerase sigma factor [Bacteroidota bacterium]MBL1143319.1 sigma-70 family RNA polymerase sigma factor [Bacteroidota bacterium]MCB0803992.1 sigma-70 family RNA polymerase sigma factor [Flavobacteriales bacterium]NOG56121.1 sigma-70 family RNA polymerase sigma factor [Bacteroidota bacterium]